jgi:hypothetical protein
MRKVDMFLFKKYPSWAEIFNEDPSPTAVGKLSKNIFWYIIIGMICSSIFYGPSSGDQPIDEYMHNKRKEKMILFWPFVGSYKLIDDTIQYIKGHEVRVEWPEGEEE